MTHSLRLEVPEHLYQSLHKMATHTGQTTEAVAVECLVNTFAQPDPLEEFIGAFPNAIADWAEEHDKYLGLAQMESLPVRRELN
jgi:hypothetical protein